MNKTIACISTPLGTGAISIIRVSGEKCLEIAKKVFFCKNKENLEPRFLYLGDFIYGNVKDKCLMAHFKAPLSYTGEDMVEFQCHGGEFLAERILEALIDCGAVLAENGEFSKRAFLNGKLTLDKAEGIIDVINATSEAELKAGYKMLKGELNKTVKTFQNRLTDCLASLEVTLDYPEHDDEEITLSQTHKILSQLNTEFEKLIATSKTGKIIKNGLGIAIIGKPNVGKSSLLNALIGEERAIVTNIAGTTRDTITETITFKGMKFNFIDTAGIRESDDIVEKIGIERSKQSIAEADIVLVVLDNSTELSQEDKTLLELTKNEKRIIILNKTDLGNKAKNQIESGKIIDILSKNIDKKLNSVENNNIFVENHSENVENDNKNVENARNMLKNGENANNADLRVLNIIEISALKKDNIEKIKEMIFDKVIDNKMDASGLVLTNMRQTNNLKSAKQVLETAISASQTETVDIVAFLVRRVWEELGKITGETEIEAVIDEIFSKFCLGK